MIIIIFGCPGAGKGTQGELLHEKIIDQFSEIKVHNIIVGEILRFMSKTDIELKEKMNSGELLPSNYINSTVDKYIKTQLISGEKDIYLYDGYPRTLEQAKYLYERIYDKSKLMMINLEVDNSTAIDRIMSRALCLDCKTTFSNKIGKCNKCSSKNLGKRSDDNKDVILNRLEQYSLKTKLVLDYFKELKDKTVSILNIDGGIPVKEIHQKIYRKFNEVFLN